MDAEWKIEVKREKKKTERPLTMEIHLSARFIKRTPNKHATVAPNTKRFQMENDIDNELLYG